MRFELYFLVWVLAISPLGYLILKPTFEGISELTNAYEIEKQVEQGGTKEPENISLKPIDLVRSFPEIDETRQSIFKLDNKKTTTDTTLNSMENEGDLTILLKGIIRKDGVALAILTTKKRDEYYSIVSVGDYFEDYTIIAIKKDSIDIKKNDSSEVKSLLNLLSDSVKTIWLRGAGEQL